jgi:hypothetical protein
MPNKDQAHLTGPEEMNLHRGWITPATQFTRQRMLLQENFEVDN